MKNLKKDQDLIHTLMGNDVSEKRFYCFKCNKCPNWCLNGVFDFKISYFKEIYIYKLRWIGIIGQLFSIYLVYFYFDFILILFANLIIFLEY